MSIPFDPFSILSYVPGAAGITAKTLAAAKEYVLGKIAAETGTKVFYIDGQKINNKETFLKTAAEAMQFPKYFGNNWDAFDECITDLTWCPAERYIILYDHADIFAQADPTQYQIALDIFNSATEYWEANHIPMKFLLINK